MIYTLFFYKNMITIMVNAEFPKVDKEFGKKWLTLYSRCISSAASFNVTSRKGK